MCTSACRPTAALRPALPTGCGHCKRLVPEYSKLGEKIASDPKLKNRVLIAKVGCLACCLACTRVFDCVL